MNDSVDYLEFKIQKRKKLYFRLTLCLNDPIPDQLFMD